MTKYYINDYEVEENEFWVELNNSIENEVDWNLDDIIDEENETIEIGCCTFYPSEILKNCDPIAYRCYADDIKYMYFEDDKYNLELGEEIERDCTTFRIEEEEEEDED